MIRRLFFPDTIHFDTKASYHPAIPKYYGALIDGRKGDQFLNDYIPPLAATGEDMELGNFTLRNGDSNGEIVAFTKGHAPTIMNAPWTDNFDFFELAFQKEFKFPVKAWIISGNVGDQRVNADLACAMTTKIWKDERQGFAFSSFTIDDQHQDPGLTNFTCDDVERITRNRMEPNAINIYYVERVMSDDGSGSPETYGINCGAKRDQRFKNVIVMGSNTSPALLAHEFGHSFALNHISAFPEFDKTNVMHEASDTRKYLSEGQTFRQATHTDSAINDPSLYQTYLTQNQGITLPAPRNCPPFRGLPAEDNWFNSPSEHQAAARMCPLLQTRLWPDGARRTPIWWGAQTEVFRAL